MSTLINYPSVPEFLADSIAKCRTTAVEIGTALGFEKPSVMQSIVDGKVKLPISVVSPLASHLRVDREHLMRLVLSDYMPEVLATLDTFSQPMHFSKHERVAEP